jgi:hypothetical protein
MSLAALKAAAEQDAWVHSMHEKCAVSVPLVISRRLSQPARISRSIGGSMLPPDRITTVRPGGVAPFR